MNSDVTRLALEMRALEDRKVLWHAQIMDILKLPYLPVECYT